MIKTGKKLSSLKDQIKEKPQVSLKVKVSKKPEFLMIPGYKELLESVRRGLSTQDRLLVRYSGTEDLARIFIEGKEPAQIQKQANRVKIFLEKHLS